MIGQGVKINQEERGESIGVCPASQPVEGQIWDAAHLRKVQEHPCYSAKAAHIFGRIHLPVAPSCNIQCKYCVREFDCVNESRPGVTSRVIGPQEALKRLCKSNMQRRIKWVKIEY